MVVRLLFLFALICWSVFGQAAITTTCRVGSGVHIPPSPNIIPQCVSGTENGSGDTGTDPRWIYSGLEFPHTGGSARSCMVLDGVTPFDYTSGWSLNVQLLFARVTGSSTTDNINFTARVTFLGADGGQDIRSPKWGDPTSNDDTPNGEPPSGTQTSLFEPYVTTIHDIDYPAGGLNVPSVRRNLAILICREDGPNTGEEDVNEGTVRVTQAYIRWEDGSNAVQSATFVPLTSTSQVVSDNSIPLPSGPDRAILSFLSDAWRSGRAYVSDPQDISIAQSTGVCTVGGSTNWPECGNTKYWAGVDLHDSQTECLIAQTEVPENILVGAGVPMDIVIKPSGSEGEFLFHAATAFIDIGDDLSDNAPYGSDVSTGAVVSCSANSQQRVRVEGLDMTGALPGKEMIIKVCRVGGDAEDTATSIAHILKLRIHWKRLIQIEEAGE